MKNIMIRVCTVAFVCLLLIGCGKEEARKNINADEQETKNNDSIVTDGYPAIEELEWEFIDGVRYEKPAALFGYTNNSEYTIVKFSMHFKQKDGLDAEVLSVFDDIKSERGISDEEIKAFGLDVYDWKVCDSGEVVTGTECYLNAVISATSVEQCEIMELESVTITYIGKDEKIHEVAFSAENGAYADTGRTDELFEWSESDYAVITPKPNTRIVTIDYDKEDYYQFTAFDMTNEQFAEYCNVCKEAGFEQNVEESSYSFYGTNEDGIRIHVRILDSMNAIEVCVEEEE